MAKPVRTHRPCRITKRVVDAAHPEPLEYTVWDTDIRGFGLRVRPNGRKVYLLKYRTSDGKARKPTIGVHGSLTADQARDVARGWQADIAKGHDPKGDRDEARRATKEAISLGDLTDLYIERYAKLRKRSWREDQRILQKYFSGWRDRGAAEISASEVAARLQVIADQNGPIMANRCRACLSKAFAWAVRNHSLPQVTVNPVRDVERPAPERERDSVYGEEDIKKLWGAFNEDGTAGQVYKFCLITGQRLNEVARMPWSEINDDLWILPGDRTKNGRVHVVPLSQMACEILDAQKGLDGRYVFPGRVENPLTVGSKAANRIKCTVANFRCHDLRRSMATECTRLGFSRFIVDRVLNHTEQGVGRVYDRHDYLQEKRGCLDAWARRLLNIVEGGGVVQMVREAGAARALSVAPTRFLSGGEENGPST